MAKVDPEKKARNKRIKELTEEMDELLDDVVLITGWKQLSLNAKIGSKHADFYDVRNEVIYSHDQYIALWLNGLMSYLDTLPNKESSNNYELLKYMQEYKCVKEYVLLFLERSYLRHYDELSKVRPKLTEAGIWIGQENANYGIFVTPRFTNGQWENDGSEIRKFKPKYFTIGHIVETGLVIPFENEQIEFNDMEEYLKFFKLVIVRNSGSTNEKEIARRYIEYVRSRKTPEDVPLLIPEFRYGGIEKKHKYRLDFTIINPYTMEKYGFELSPWSSHGYITKTKEKSQKEINEEAKNNFENEMKKHKDYFRRHGVYCFIYTDEDLENIDSVFDDIKNFLKPKRMAKQLMIHTMDRFENYK